VNGEEDLSANALVGVGVLGVNGSGDHARNAQLGLRTAISNVTPLNRSWRCIRLARSNGEFPESSTLVNVNAEAAGLTFVF
jgi:hypothetical protein